MDIFDIVCGLVAIVLLIAFFYVMGGATEKGVDAAKHQYEATKTCTPNRSILTIIKEALMPLRLKIM